ncbi:MAG: peptidoglycan-binding protein [Oscillospiraceae bacterium]|nr:peptidoglycan-binding protein [Oscillospiraceae bacterium]
MAANYTKIFLGLKAGGLTEEAVWAVMGNLNCESNLEPCRLQGDFQTGYPASRSYAEAVDSGIKSKESFATDAKGWGLAQWTYPSRKRALWEYAKAKNRSIGDLELQIAFLLKELKEDFASLYRFLQQTNNMYEATDRFCREFENPAVKNVSARYNSAKWLRVNAKLSSVPTGTSLPVGETSSTASGPPSPEGKAWPPRMICVGMKGLDVTLLQTLLTLRGYSCSVSGEFTKETDKKLRQFQADSDSLMIDGIAGPLSWRELLKY